jgi:two-component system chemotaxis response regulator CheB
VTHQTVLIAEDDWLVAQAVKRAATEVGLWVVGVAADGQVAVQMACDLRPDLVLMDLEMPGLRGEEAAARLAGCCPVPVIALSAHPPDSMDHFAGFVAKPPNSDELRALVDALLGRRG